MKMWVFFFLRLGVFGASFKSFFFVTQSLHARTFATILTTVMDNASTLEASEFLEDPVKGTGENKYHLEFRKSTREGGSKANKVIVGKVGNRLVYSCTD